MNENINCSKCSNSLKMRKPRATKYEILKLYHDCFKDSHPLNIVVWRFKEYELKLNKANQKKNNKI